MRATSLRVLAAVGTPADAVVIERGRLDAAPEVRQRPRATTRIGDEPTRCRSAVGGGGTSAPAPGLDMAAAAARPALGDLEQPTDWSPLRA